MNTAANGTWRKGNFARPWKEWPGAPAYATIPAKPRLSRSTRPRPARTPFAAGRPSSRLVELSDLPTVLIQILRSGASVGLGGAIQLAATGDAPELLLSDGLVEDQLTNDPAVVRRASSILNGVRGDALNRADSRDFLVEAVERWST